MAELRWTFIKYVDLEIYSKIKTVYYLCLADIVHFLIGLDDAGIGRYDHVKMSKNRCGHVFLRVAETERWVQKLSARNHIQTDFKGTAKTWEFWCLLWWETSFIAA